jgi:hypothetical protein
MNRKKRTLFVLIPLLSLFVVNCGLVPSLVSKPEPTVTPVPTTSQVKGVLIASETKKPVEAYVSLLAITLDPQGFFFDEVDYDHRSIFKNKTTSQGSFVFENVRPGPYVMMAEMECSPQQIGDEARTNILQIKVDAGQVVDLGTLTVYLSLIEKGNPCN